MEKSIGLIKRNYLSQGQKVLYEVICDKLKSNSPIYTEEAISIWKDNVCRLEKDGVPCYWNWYHTNTGELDKDGHIVWKPGLTPLTNSEITTRSLGWLMMSIGALVLKGYLKIIPQISLS